MGAESLWMNRNSRQRPPRLALSHSHCRILRLHVSSQKARTTENLCSEFSPPSPLAFTTKCHGNTSFVEAYYYKAEF